MFKNLILILIFWFLILQNIALANKFKVKDLEIDLFDKNKQIENSKYIREAFGRVEIKIFAEKTDDENIGPIIFILKSRFEKYGLEVRKFYLDYFFNNKLAIFNNESANYQTIDKKKTNAFQANNNLLMTDNASIDTKPQLEIYADDVACSHGCTIGQLDEDALFYLRSRGIAKKEAQAMLMYAFANDVLENIKIPELKNKLNRIIAEKLGVQLDIEL